VTALSKQLVALATTRPHRRDASFTGSTEQLNLPPAALKHALQEGLQGPPANALRHLPVVVPPQDLLLMGRDSVAMSSVNGTSTYTLPTDSLLGRCTEEEPGEKRSPRKAHGLSSVRK
jgi:hypothetical protein